MREEWYIIVLITSVFLIGAVGLLLTEVMIGFHSSDTENISQKTLSVRDDVYVYQYSADFYLNGTLEERFIYQISTSGKYRMLYRNFNELLARGKLNLPSFELVEVRPPAGTTAYLKDWSGRVEIISGDASRASEIQSLAMTNEVGCYLPERFSQGRYEISYLFKVHPPLECDDEYCHLNLKLADEHLPYRTATIAIHDENGSVRRIFPHPPMQVVQEADAPGS